MASTRKPRRKVTTDLGRQMLQRERQRLARQQAELGERLVNETATRRMFESRTETTVLPEHIAVTRGILTRVSAVLASEDVHVPIFAEAVSKAKPFQAWTDFDKISVTYRMHDDVRLTAAVLRGMLYHEGGHCRFTLPFVLLQSKARPAVALPTDRTYHRAWNCLEDQRMETAVVSDSPRKAAYFTPVVLAELCPTLDKAAANYPLLVWRKYLPRNIRTGARKLFVMQHGEKLAIDIENVVDEYVTATDVETMAKAVIAMEKLLQRCSLAFNLDNSGHDQHGHRVYRQNKQDEWNDDALSIPISPDMLDEDFDGASDEEDEEPVIDPTDPAVAQQLAMVFSHLFIDPWNLIPVQYVIPTLSAPSEGESDGPEGPGDLLGDDDDDEYGDEEDEGDEGEGHGDQDTADDEDGETEDGSYGETEDDETDEDEDDDEFDAAWDSDDEDEDDFDDEDGQFDGDDDEQELGGSTGTHEDDGSHAQDRNRDLTQEALDEALAEAEEERLNDKVLDGDTRAFQDALTDSVSKLEPYVGGVSGDGEAIAVAENLATEIEQAFHEATMDRMPAWVEQQRRGIINVLRYETRQPGEHEFYRAWVDDDQPGFDMAVSVLLDYSGSMASSMTALAQVGYACKRACDRLNIPCTVTLWDTEARTLYDASERVEHLPVLLSNGGTNPQVALSDLDNQRHNKAKHIVLIMTDGAWDGAWETYSSREKAEHSLSFYSDEGRKIIGLGYDGASEYGLLRKGADEAYAIKDLMEIPRHLERSLIDMA